AQIGPWATLYFVLLMTFGNYVLFNLLVAILVEGFQESKEDEKREAVRDSTLRRCLLSAGRCFILRRFHLP
ncbi:MAG: ion transporter, partial [Mesoflavibacter sp.]|nr:ion transporter [Mesoflavibacter sp.]